MTVCLTGDVHHMSLETRDQAYLDRSELSWAVEYAKIAGRYSVPVTLFVTGKAVVESPRKVEQLTAMDHVELGGHNYYAFSTPIHTLSRGLLGSWNGPRWFQAWEISRTIDALDGYGVDVTTWRDHAYRHDQNTASLLKAHGITHFSDAVGPDQQVRTKDDLTVVPVNTPPDHEHLYHAFRTPEFVAECDFEGPFGTESREVDGWHEWVLEATDRAVERGGTATILAHPACMGLADGLDAFEQLCSNIGDNYETKPVSAVKVSD